MILHANKQTSPIIIRIDVNCRILMIQISLIMQSSKVLLFPILKRPEQLLKRTQLMERWARWEVLMKINLKSNFYPFI